MNARRTPCKAGTDSRIVVHECGAGIPARVPVPVFFGPRRRMLTATIAVALGVIVMASRWSRADDENGDAPPPAAAAVPADADAAHLIQLVVSADNASSTWIGVLAVPASEALQAQLKLKDRLIVQHVLPDSPAAQAGLQQFDILLKFGDQEITSLEDLMKAVRENLGRKTQVTLLRSGVEQKLTVEPAARPEVSIEAVVTEDGARLAGEALLNRIVTRTETGQPGSLRFGIVGPGLVAEHGDLADALARLNPTMPENLSISISKKGSQPAKIVVERDEDRWEISEENLDELPEDIRPHVARMIGSQTIAGIHVIPRTGDLRELSRPFSVRRQVQEHVRDEEADAESKPDGDSEPNPQTSNRRVQRVEVVRELPGALNELREEMRALRAEVEKLKQTAAPETPSTPNTP